MVRKDEKGKPESRWETYQRVKGNRTTRLTSRCVLKRKKWDDPNERVQEEAVHLLPPGLRKREHQEMDAEGAIDSRTAANFNWAVTARLHAFANLQRSLPEISTSVNALFSTLTPKQAVTGHATSILVGRLLFRKGEKAVGRVVIKGTLRGEMKSLPFISLATRSEEKGRNGADESIPQIN
uniref:E3 ubiquitin-protein ligase RNF220 middle domain-containing protein n=2 Tax=Araneus ventricosus TaxID=182803 RepID=A0A4Y2THE3_ARAVE|nr:hypothetical protein AVEN_13332-1 [Araneus ventricosus]